MAIAFYIPDQNKLLASYNGSNNTNNNSNNNNNNINNNNNSNNNGNSHHQTNMNHHTNLPTTHQQQQPTRPQSNNSNNTNNNHHHHQSGSPSQSPSQSPSSPTTTTTTDNQTSSNFRANITIPLTTYNTAGRRNNSDGNIAVGCWELFAQVFCYALCCYRATLLNPTAIQISFELSNGGFLDNGGSQLPATTTGTTTEQETLNSELPSTTRFNSNNS